MEIRLESGSIDIDIGHLELLYRMGPHPDVFSSRTLLLFKVGCLHFLSQTMHFPSLTSCPQFFDKRRHTSTMWLILNLNGKYKIEREIREIGVFADLFGTSIE